MAGRLSGDPTGVWHHAGMAPTVGGKSDDLGAPTSRRLSRPGGVVPALVSGLIDRIAGGEFRPGEAFPNEASLALEYGVSRTVVREAMRMLSEKRLVTVRHGRSPVVSAAEDWDLVDSDVLAAQVAHDSDYGVITQLVHVRAAVEGELACLAAGLMDDAARKTLQGLFDELAGRLDHPREYHEADRSFHDHIMRCSANSYGRVVVQRVSAWARAVPRPFGYDPREVELAHAGHTEVLDAILRRDGDAASGAMRAHILGTWELRLKINS